MLPPITENVSCDRTERRMKSFMQSEARLQQELRQQPRQKRDQKKERGTGERPSSRDCGWRPDN